ncbi:hypothetical protein DCS_03553 [Drechmeria coniospora]|uniref:Cyclin-D1-binding protein 1-like N-terminal domain-containing protein n=1 Tax=Drechmeria coniospora TaxID=98403 RepID=A0A151GHF3_DRECN|nr:hypothetical protein DCS_03553 [Drechmeria coniospora]KYK56553.1 hypothetical protein DCS_03553 [Drechmeria coniospora]
MARPTEASLQSLDSIIRTASVLLAQLQEVLSDIQKNPHPSGQSEAATASPPVNALALAHDSASLIRAHGTKISLLIINEPFSANAVSSVLRELLHGPVPALALAPQECTADKYTTAVRRELASRCRKVLADLHELLAKIPKNGQSLSSDEKSGIAAGGRGSIPATGILWSACDDVIGIANNGIAHFYAAKLGHWKSLLGDIMEELKEWAEEDSDEDDEDEDDDGEDYHGDERGEADDAAQAMVDELFNSQPHIPRLDPDSIRPRLDVTLKRLRLVTLLYDAAIKRRFKTLPAVPLPSSSTTALRLDELANVLESLPSSFDDLAAAFYDLQPQAIDDAMEKCFVDALAASELLAKTWDDKTDEFSTWLGKFQSEMQGKKLPPKNGSAVSAK